MTRLTSSKTDLALRCAWGFRPDAGPGNTATSAAAEAGTAEHGHIENSIEEEADAINDEAERSFIADSLTTGESLVDARSETHRRWLLDWWPQNRHLEWRTEYAIAIDPATGETRRGPPNWPHRDYGWAPPRMVPGTIDAWAIEDETLRVCDWKCGQASHVGDPRTSGQLRTNAVALARAIGHRGPISLEFVKVNESRLWVETATVSRLDLLAFQAELARLVAALDGNPQPVEGHWCHSMYCAHLGRCPLTRGALDSVRGGRPGDPFRIATTAAELSSDEHAAWQYRTLRAADKILEEAWAAEKERARSRPVPLGDGVVYGEVEKSRERVLIDAPGAEHELRRVLGTHFWSVIKTKREATKGRIEEAARGVAAERSAGGKKVAIKAVAAEAFLALRQCGGMKLSEYRELAEHKPGEAGATKEKAS